MRFDKDDPRLIDYALGELTEKENKEIEKALQAEENAEARKVVEEIRSVAEISTHALQYEEENKLRGPQRMAVLDHACDEAVSPAERRASIRWFPVLMKGAVAACIILGFGYVMFQPISRSRSKSRISDFKIAKTESDVEEMKISGGKLGQRNKELSELRLGIEAEEILPAANEEIEEPSRPDSQKGIDGIDAAITDAPVSRKDNDVSQSAMAVFETETDKPMDVQVYSAGIESRSYSDPSSPTTIVRRPSGPNAPMKGKTVPAVTSSRNGNAGKPGSRGRGSRVSGGEISLNFDRKVPVRSVDGNVMESPAPEAMTYDYSLGGMRGGMGSGARAGRGGTGGRIMGGARGVSVSDEAFSYNGAYIDKKKDRSEYLSLSAPVPMVDDHIRRIPEEPGWQYVPQHPHPAHRRHSGEAYAPIIENDFLQAAQKPLSTFSIDVDTASYSNARRFITQGSLPPRDAVRLEEFINYFKYSYPKPQGESPFAVHVELGDCPLAPEHRLAKIGIQGKQVNREERPDGNFVFLLDVSGSMKDSNKLPLVKESMKALLSELQEKDRVGIVVYASDSRVYLNSASCDNKERILDSIDSLHAGGSTNGGAGIKMAYDMARQHYIEGGINRVILATDGDFNVGITDRSDLMQLIKRQAKSNVFLSALGFGMGNIKDATLEQLADKGNGNYAYIDNYTEARRTLVEQLTGTLITIAKDVKIQVEFNPAKVAGYRLLGYENRVLAARDFNDDTKDAGEIGAGHTVTALYEIVPVGHWPQSGVDPLKYQPVPQPKIEDTEFGDELMNVKLRYKHPEGSNSSKIEIPVKDQGTSLEEMSNDFRFAAAVTAFGMELRDSKYKGNTTYDMILDLGRNAKAGDSERQNFIDMVVTAKTLSHK